MYLYIKQRVFSWGSKFDIYNEKGEPLYLCKGEVFTFGKKLRIYDNENRELVYIQQELFHMLPHYNIFIDGKKEAVIVRKFTFFSHDYYFKGKNWTISGDYMAHNYTVTADGNYVMNISKKWFSWGDTYELDINDEYNPLLCLASAIVVDCVCHDSN